MDPITIGTAWTITKTAGEISKKLFEFGKTLKDREAKQHVDEIVDNLRDLKQRASEFGRDRTSSRMDERNRLKSDEYEFRNPFWYHKAHPKQRLCPKCFAKGIAAAMGDTSDRCLVCSEYSFDHRVSVVLPPMFGYSSTTPKTDFALIAQTVRPRRFIFDSKFHASITTALRSISAGYRVLTSQEPWIIASGL